MQFLYEAVFDMPPRSMAGIEALGEAVLTALSPECLRQPVALDVLRLVEVVLPQLGIDVYPAARRELKDREGATDPTGVDGIIILILEEFWHNLLDGGREAFRARATVIHELCHALLHVPVVRARLASPHRDLLLARVRRGSLPAYRDPEWQAWALAGCVLMPRRTLVMLRGLNPWSLSDVYQVSPSFVNSHLRRLKLDC